MNLINISNVINNYGIPTKYDNYKYLIRNQR